MTSTPGRREIVRAAVGPVGVTALFASGTYMLAPLSHEPYASVRSFSNPNAWPVWVPGAPPPTLGLVAPSHGNNCLLYTSDAADERSSVDLGGRRIIKKKK